MPMQAENKETRNQQNTILLLHTNIHTTKYQNSAHIYTRSLWLPTLKSFYQLSRHAADADGLYLVSLPHNRAKLDVR